jgi:uncharacterized protein YuzE
MRVTYDPEADAAFIYLVPSIGFGEAVRSRFCDIGLKDTAMTLSLDEGGRILGIEILGVTKALPVQAVRLLESEAEAP